MFWQTTRFRIDLSRPQVMGIVNVTPDSFSDGGRHASTAAALAHCEALLRDGADMLDIGAESTRPGSEPVSIEEELARLLPGIASRARAGLPGVRRHQQTRGDGGGACARHRHHQ